MTEGFGAADGVNNAIVYTRAEILSREEANEINKFAEYWKCIKGNVTETLVFDCKFTTYGTLDNLARACYYIMRDKVLYDPAETFQ